ncbi:ABC transporter ATP-binding protein [Rhizobium ruizarguesonis]|jgi:putative spermidine/putrescine transport system ATP-binding protein|uniref:ABC transporter ATP-binding protein n=1 Tax=Rhizobium ruizarguesonis TaxID=2081791 RepID=UPI00103207B7|nr:ABC transporter ATP-binding protein [Rhizobium ruizarguesonis]NKL39731.1 polyamine ABC transporter ATP-binding protein [Rhizobium leguminosarum bv. viciae]QIO48200.1 ABC transporter ATP-binding protein [Rhizobium leguminosarum bv. trifolii]NEJ02791.1 polyamine ABC transporter ATP-binding protein [Rhizobium ruizarguesonis]NEJ40615.1 polyamine ABC transporter ATP-binding protein [Rhizobium ruizarguesonis]TAU92788.1 ABC transporter ATP-binding protein [Rhizobium ruizarguesonis]
MPASEHIVRFDAVEKTYDGANIVVKRLNLNIRRGEFLTMLGPSGSGKTTSLMMLAGFEAPTSGAILLDGRPIEKLPPHRRNIGVVFQNYALFPNMSVAENVAFPLQMRKVSKADQSKEVQAALDMVQMGQFASRKPAQLSGGQQQRIALARALVFKPSLVLMDEPLGALDKQLREHMQLEIKHLHEQLGISIVYVTHDQGEALTMSDRIAIFNDGVVQQLGSPNEVYERPANPFVARFIGDNNALQGRVESVDGLVCRIQLDGSQQMVRGRSNGSLRPGSRTTLSIRPERIQIDPDGKHENVALATIEEVIYLGDHVRVRVSALGSSEIIIKVANGAVGSSELAKGGALNIGWSESDCAALQ